MELDKKRIDRIVRFALKEDIWTGDITSQAVLDRFLVADAVIIAREKGVICGMGVVERVFASVDYCLKFKPMVSDGDNVNPGQEVAFIEGEAWSILKAERVALNFLSMLSGTATRTRSIVEMVKGTGVKIYDTRKTIPLHRYLQKYAVRVGGGYNHRQGLYDMVLIKDNHIKAFAMQKDNADSEKVIKEIVHRARKNVQSNIRVEIEVETLAECGYALEAAPDVIMLDNMDPETIRKAVECRREKDLEGKVLFEVSGGMNEANIMGYAVTGVDMISIGALTGTVKGLDLSMEVVYRRG
ncbi:MAG: carboxylating nicotinate-nucleotide diphosphorylase [Candidatus Omnitrophica bacterium]|nr:carboxylating nicotinate-nucleotide diphosphorylase [Candidatus Omnitrophota bacterium]MDD5487443.1 carboxylating nicotinate-nucleotide diphosphorylase [Candidatus Omnitrophota bacterium]